ncbi:MAG: efflux RND transporter periplasmic adaptor subunit [Pseudomonadota bacterium]|nr:efflux RND transporter periplasmic adaptor subunit [Pseudomonadota bacterium]
MEEKSALLQKLRIDRDPPPTDEGRGMPRWALASALILLALAAGGWFMASRAALPVHTAAAQPISGGPSSASVLDATGYVTARRQATVSAQITGTLTHVLIEEGDHVKTGQILGRLDDTAQRASLQQAQAQLLSAQALLVQYEAQLAQNSRDVKRAEDLVERKLVSQQTAEQARTLVQTSSAQAQAQRRQIQLAEANVRSAQVQLDYCTVRAPFTGVVIAKSAQVGEIVSPFSAGGGFTRTGIGTIVDMDSLEVDVDVNEAYINRVQPGQPVDSVLNAYPDWKIPSHVIAIIPTADRSKATVKIRVGLDLKDARIVPDMGVRVSFLDERKPGAPNSLPPHGVLVPTAALRKAGERDVVFLMRNRVAERRTVTLGSEVGDSRQVLTGVSPGEIVILDAPAGLQDNAPVAVAKP